MSQVLTAEAIGFLRTHRISSLATVDGDAPWVRAMYIARVDDDGSIWYAAGQNSAKIKHIGSNAKVSLTSYEGNQEVRIFGTAVVVKDQTIKDALWEDSWSAYFTGKDDPAYVLIKVTPQRAEFNLS